MTQYDRILKHLEDYKSITSWEAIEKYGATRISAIIYNLRKDGYKIKTEFKTSVNRYGDKTSYGVYRLEEENE